MARDAPPSDAVEVPVHREGPLAPPAGLPVRGDDLEEPPLQFARADLAQPSPEPDAPPTQVDIVPSAAAASPTDAGPLLPPELQSVLDDLQAMDVAEAATNNDQDIVNAAADELRETRARANSPAPGRPWTRDEDDVPRRHLRQGAAVTSFQAPTWTALVLRAPLLRDLRCAIRLERALFILYARNLRETTDVAKSYTAIFSHSGSCFLAVKQKKGATARSSSSSWSPPREGLAEVAGEGVEGGPRRRRRPTL